MKALMLFLQQPARTLFSEGKRLGQDVVETVG